MFNLSQILELDFSQTFNIIFIIITPLVFLYYLVFLVEFAIKKHRPPTRWDFAFTIFNWINVFFGTIFVILVIRADIIPFLHYIFFVLPWIAYLVNSWFAITILCLAYVMMLACTITHLVFLRIRKKNENDRKEKIERKRELANQRKEEKIKALEEERAEREKQLELEKQRQIELEREIEEERQKRLALEREAREKERQLVLDEENRRKEELRLAFERDVLLEQEQREKAIREAQRLSQERDFPPPPPPTPPPMSQPSQPQKPIIRPYKSSKYKYTTNYTIVDYTIPNQVFCEYLDEVEPDKCEQVKKSLGSVKPIDINKTVGESK
ncbi:MAG: hypothetical protein FWE13_05155 [Firmicutes bacterium]|nr:hypothetical protein [Bacillota bacterium]